MKKLIVLILVLTMALSLAGCHTHHWEAATCESPKICNDCGATEGEPLGHTPGSEAITAVDVENLTVTYAISCSVCGKEMETRESATGIAPENGVLALSADEWYGCLTTNIQQLGASQTLYPYPAESQDGTLICAVVSPSQLQTVFTFNDADGNALTTQQSSDRSLIHNIRLDGQFTNDNAKEFFMLLMIVLINNNASLDFNDANVLSSQIMSGNPVSDNGYTYAMEIVSVENHTVCVSITAE